MLAAQNICNKNIPEVQSTSFNILINTNQIQLLTQPSLLKLRNNAIDRY